MKTKESMYRSIWRYRSDPEGKSGKPRQSLSLDKEMEHDSGCIVYGRCGQNYYQGEALNHRTLYRQVILMQDYLEYRASRHLLENKGAHHATDVNYCGESCETSPPGS